MQLEDRLLVTSARVKSSLALEEGSYARQRLEELARRVADWEYVVGAAWSHGVTPLVYHSLKELSPSAVPAHVVERLREGFHRQGMMIHLQVQELLEVLDTFSRHEIPAITFKGPALAVQAYGHAALRKPGDLDLLIRRRDFAHARSLLISRGYEPHVPADEEERYLETRGGIAFSRGAFQVDLHWTLEQRRFDSLPFSFQLPLGDVWREAVEVSLRGGSVRTLSPEHHFLFVCFHGAKHFWQKLYLVCDVAELIRSFPEMNWDGILATANALRITRIVHLATDLAHRHLQAPVPPDVVEAIGAIGSRGGSAKEAGEWLFDGRSVDMGSHLFRIGMLESLPAKISYVMNRSLRKITKLNRPACKPATMSRVTGP